MCSSHQPEEGADSGTYNLSSDGLILPEGMEVLPGTVGGLRGPTRGSHGGYLSPVGVLHPSGKGVRAWYCHNYKTEAEHWHHTHEQMEECKRLNGQETIYDS